KAAPATDAIASERANGWNKRICDMRASSPEGYGRAGALRASSRPLPEERAHHMAVPRKYWRGHRLVTQQKLTDFEPQGCQGGTHPFATVHRLDGAKTVQHALCPGRGLHFIARREGFQLGIVGAAISDLCGCSIA